MQNNRSCLEGISIQTQLWNIRLIWKMLMVRTSELAEIVTTQGVWIREHMHVNTRHDIVCFPAKTNTKTLILKYQISLQFKNFAKNVNSLE